MEKIKRAAELWMTLAMLVLMVVCLVGMWVLVPSTSIPVLFFILTAVATIGIVAFMARPVYSLMKYIFTGVADWA